jgi:hypothetical protein
MKILHINFPMVPDFSINKLNIKRQLLAITEKMKDLLEVPGSQFPSLLYVQQDFIIAKGNNYNKKTEW